MFEEFLGKPLKIKPHDPETFTQLYSEIYGEWKRLKDEGIEVSEPKEKELLEKVDSSMSSQW